MASPERERVLSVKRGEVAQATVLEDIAEIEKATEALLDNGRTPLPEHPDWDEIGAWSTEAHRRHWGW